MKKHILAALFFTSFFLLTGKGFAQSCFDCSYDSLVKQFWATEPEQEKADLLIKIIHTRMSGDTTLYFINQLLQLEGKVKGLDIEPYKALRDAYIHMRARNQPGEALEDFKKAVSLFDKNKTVIVSLLANIRNLFNRLNQQEEKFQYYREKLEYYKIHGPIENTAPCYHGIAGYYVNMADYNQAISNYLRAAHVFKKFSRSWYMNEISVVAVQYAEWGNSERAQYYNDSTLILAAELDSVVSPYHLHAFSRLNLRLKNYKEALAYADQILDRFPPGAINRFYAIGEVQKSLVLTEMGQPQKGYAMLMHARKVSDTFNSQLAGSAGTLEIDYALYKYFRATRQPDSAEKYILIGYGKSVKEKARDLELKYLRALSDFYIDEGKADRAQIYFDQYASLQDTLSNQQSALNIAQYEIELKELEQNERINILKQERAVQEFKLGQRNKIIWGASGILLLISTMLFFIFRQLQQNKKILRKLRSTQSLLVQQEKMASLGELTAGIAHEIQNPLNFVNNFSEINTELIDEMEESLQQGKMDQVHELARYVKDNNQKVIQHGRRADAIVKGMLLHSRSSTGNKEATDINALADEYLRLSYHGLRAKDKSFNATISTHYDESLGPVPLVPQDIGRVLLNMYSNAFYSVYEKKKTAGSNYEPRVSVSTGKEAKDVVIRIEDNGSGIPDKVLDKIYQPFFTTKPAGDGTGLGLSLSYEIIQAHEGSLNVESKEGEFAAFTIRLPL